MRLESVVRSLAAWLVVWGFWLGVTRDHHPRFLLAVIVTTSLVVAYALAFEILQRVLIPGYWKTGRRRCFAAWLALTMASLTGLALAIIRISYRELWGPDPDPNGVYKHYLIDLFGMMVHLIGGFAVVSVVRAWRRRAGRR